MGAIEKMDFTGTQTRAPLSVRMIDTLGRVIRHYKNRRAIYQLSEMSDTQLADIGLSRADLHVAYDMPLDTDPTEQLGIMASARARDVLKR